MNEFEVNAKARIDQSLANIDDVARASGVSKGTVSSVFSKKRPISKEVTERVLDAARQLNYKPNYWARSLANKSTRIVGLSIRSESLKFNQFDMCLLNGVIRVCSEQGYRLLINTLSGSHLTQLEHMTSDPVDGEILLDPETGDPRIKDRLAGQIPVVIVGRPPKEFESRLCYVDNDNVDLANRVTHYLLSLGHRHILFLNSPAHRTVAEDRTTGYLAAYSNLGLPVSSSWVVYKPDQVGPSLTFGYETALAILKRSPRPSAVITDSDSMALGVYKAAEQLNLRIPEDLSVFAFSDDMVLSPEFKPPLNGTNLNAEQLGVEAARMLLEQIESRSKTAKRALVAAELVLRHSCTMIVN